MAGSLRKDQSFKGFETWLSNVKMGIKMHLYIILSLLIFQVMITLIISYAVYSSAWGTWINYTYQAARSFEFGYITQKSLPYLKFLIGKSFKIFLFSFVIWLAYPFVISRFSRRAKRQSKDEHLRGAMKIKPEELNELIRKDNEKVDIPLGTIVKMPISAEVKHCFVIGRPGVGKTTAISQVIARLKEREAKGIIYDFKGDYLSKFYDSNNDIIFNPLDFRCLKWNIFNEIETYMDIDSVSTSLIPPAFGEQAFWNDAARDVFAGILHYLYKNNAKTNANIWAAVTAEGIKIADWLKHTQGGERGYRYIEDASSKQALSIFSVMMQYVKSFEYMSSVDGSFSIKDWLLNKDKGFIFITSYADVEATLKPMLSLFVDLLGRKLLSMPDCYDRRIFFLLDEFGTLQRLSTITKLLTLSRSKGGSCWIGIQDIGQLDKIYTPALRQTIINACGSNIIFSVADPETAKFLSDKLGEKEYVEVEETQSMGTEDYRDGISLVRRKRTERLILASEIQNLRDLTAFLKLPNYNVVEIQFNYKHYEDKTKPFICRDDLNLENIIQKQKSEIEIEISETSNAIEKIKNNMFSLSR